MSWKSQQDYTLGFQISRPTTAVAVGIVSGVDTLIFTSPSIPKGTFLVIVNEVNIPTGTLTQGSLRIETTTDGVVAVQTIDADITSFPSLAYCVKSDGTNVVTVHCDCTTGAGTWTIGAGVVQITQLTNN